MTIVIGKRSNLSQLLEKNIQNIFLVSTNKIEVNLDKVLENIENKKINIIFNNFQPSILLNDNSNFNGYLNNAILNTSKVLTYLIKNNVRIEKIIYTSSSSVYGNNKFCSENDQVKPMSLQGALKVTAEELIKRFCTEHKINFTIARIFNMYGGSDNFSIISKIKNTYYNKGVLNIINEGKSIRDYIHIDDVVKVYQSLLKKDKLPNILNIASGNGKRVSDILTFLEKKGLTIKTKNLTREEISASIADISALNEVINTEEFIDIKDYLYEELCT